MTNYARIIDGVAIDVSADPANDFHPDIAAEFVVVPDNVRYGWTKDAEGVWAPPAIVYLPEVVDYPRVSPVEFKMLFTSAERVAIREAQKTDAVIADFFDLVDDPRLSYVDLALPSVQGVLTYLAAVNLIQTDRIAVILKGVVQ